MNTINANKLKEARKRSGLTQVEVAEAVGITQQFLSQLESGRKNKTDKLLLLAAVLQATPEDITDDDVLTDAASHNAVREPPPPTYQSRRPQEAFAGADFVHAVVLRGESEARLLSLYRKDPIVREMINRIISTD